MLIRARIAPLTFRSNHIIRNNVSEVNIIRNMSSEKPDSTGNPSMIHGHAAYVAGVAKVLTTFSIHEFPDILKSTNIITQIGSLLLPHIIMFSFTL